MLRGFLDEQKHEGGRGREVEGLCAVIHTEEHCNYFLCVSFLSQARACYKFYEQSCHIVILPLELYVLSNLMSFPYLLSQRGMSRGYWHSLLRIALQSCSLSSRLSIFHPPLPTGELKNDHA